MFRVLKVLRNHWKKSTLGFAVLSYGFSYGLDKYRTLQMMRSYCAEAKLYGEEVIPSTYPVRHVTVILNPAAGNGKAKSLYERYVSPLLHLAGIKISVIQTECEGQAKDLMEIMENTDAVVIAGGNGTLHEAVTGLLRRPEFEGNRHSHLPIGVIPLGKTNIIAKQLFWTEDSSNAKWLADSAMAIIRQTTSFVDMMKIKGNQGKPVYALSQFEMGVFSDLEHSLSKYWYFGALKAKVAYILNSVKKWNIVENADLEHVLPCDGCSKCYNTKVSSDNKEYNRWWSVFVPRTKAPQRKDCSNINNEDCGVWRKESSPFSNIMVSIRTYSEKQKEQNNAMLISVYPHKMGFMDFIRNGWKHHEGDDFSRSEICPFTAAKEVKLSPEETKGRWYYIDDEHYEAQPVQITFLPKHLLMYSKSTESNTNA